MKTTKARAAFLKTKQDLSPRTLEQYDRALDHLERDCPELIRERIARLKQST